MRFFRAFVVLGTELKNSLFITSYVYTGRFRFVCRKGIDVHTVEEQLVLKADFLLAILSSASVGNGIHRLTNSKRTISICGKVT